MSECRLDYGAAGASEHQMLCKALDVGLAFDQLDPSHSGLMEVISRRLQTIHDRWKHKLPSLSAKDGDDESFLMLGLGEVRNNLGVSPQLTRWLGERLAGEALSAKERRKVREERALAAKKQ